MTTTASPTAAIAPFRWACPACRGDLALPSTTLAHCPTCDITYPREDGIWRYLATQDAPRIAAFAHEYATVREAEGWRQTDDDYFRALPTVPPDDPHAAIWRRRSASYTLLLDRVVGPLEWAHDRPLAILDLGAGNCWLAHRLARRGHHVAAVDLLTNDWDGLGAHTRYATDRIVPIQATFDHLPLAAATADLAIFNAALHYSADYAATLAATLRALRPGGQLVILDSPLYHDPASGARMVRERQAAFQQRHGFASDTLDGVGYLTPAMLDTLGAQLGLTWTYLDATPTWRHTARRWRSRLPRRRETATMPLIVGHIGGRGGSVTRPRCVARGGTVTTPRGRVTDPPLPPDLHTSTIPPQEPNRRRPVSWRVSAPQARFQPPTSQPTSQPPPYPPSIRALARRLIGWRYRLFQRHRYDNLVIERVHGTPILVLPQVFNPQLLRTGAFLVGALDDTLIPPGATVLDMGTGSGVGAVFAARLARRVVAVDINPAAVRCARINALLHDLADRIDVREGDLFAPVTGERFDAILFNPPYFRGTPRDALDHAWRSNDTVERFAAQLRDHLTPRGHALVVLSTDGDSPAFLRTFADHGFIATVVAERDYVNEIVTVYRLAVVSRES